KGREWRTRGRARYDLAKIALKRGNTDKALDELEKAFNEGYRNDAKLSIDKDFEPVRTNTRFLALTARAKPAQITIPTFATPFAHDALSGEPALLPRQHASVGDQRMTGIHF